MSKPSALFILLLLFASCTTVYAETQRRNDGGNEMLLRVQLQMKDLAAERDALQAKNKELDTELEKLRKDNNNTTKKLATLQERLSTANQQEKSTAAELTAAQVRNEALTEQNQELVQRYKKLHEQSLELVERFKQTVNDLRLVEAERTDLGYTLEERNRDLGICARNNVALYDTNMELMRQYQEKGFLDALVQAEPVTGLKQVEIENLAQEYRRKMDEFRVDDRISGSTMEDKTQSRN